MPGSLRSYRDLDALNEITLPTHLRVMFHLFSANTPLSPPAGGTKLSGNPFGLQSIKRPERLKPRSGLS